MEKGRASAFGGAVIIEAVGNQDFFHGANLEHKKRMSQLIALL